MSENKVITSNRKRSFLAEYSALINKKIKVQLRSSTSFDTLIPCLLIVLGTYLSQLDLIPPSLPTRSLSIDFQ